ncbi:DnaB-like helicase C-terminal domain-containing protein [Borreliella garinii]|uniref:DnaB-like helicase C-terminal domain-containing protein n=1 Tax=Borreliella garinii TaxID=29519 RepID=UPI001AEF7440|nr:DnaB-like helicase C-terminal domain-containing protein [Borreliella garinii]
MDNNLKIKDFTEKYGLFNRHSESVVISGLLNNTVEIEKVLLHLRPEDFYCDLYRKIFVCIVDLHQKGVSIDPSIVFEDLEKNSKSRKVSTDFDANEYIETLSKCTMIGSILETHCNIVRNCSARRSIIEFANSVNQAAIDKSTDLVALIDNIQNKANSLELSYKNKNLLTGIDLIKNLRNRKESSAIHSGFSGLDNIIKGFKKGDYVIFGARPGVGKTTFALNIANNLCKQNRSVGFFSIEVVSNSITMSLVSINSGVEYDKIENNSLMNENERDIYEKTCSKIENYFIVVDNTPNIRIHDLKAKARKMKKYYGVEIIFIDYIGLISVEHNNTPRFEQVSFLSRNIRALAIELEIPIIVLCQLNREAEGRAPNLANLRESGSLEQDADIVIFLHRENEEQQDSYKEVRKVKIIVAKNRHGATGTVTMGFKPKSTKFVNLSPNSYAA